MLCDWAVPNSGFNPSKKYIEISPLFFAAILPLDVKVKNGLRSL